MAEVLEIEWLLGERGDKFAFLAAVDVLVNGPFLLGEGDLSLRFRGSRNQRLLDVRASLKTASAVPLL